MSGNAAAFVGSIPQTYDQGLGPVIFADFAAVMARRAASFGPMRVLETAAGTGIVTRCLRDLLPAGAHVTATDLNLPMLEVARHKFAPDDAVEFRLADAMALPFPDGAFDAVLTDIRIDVVASDRKIPDPAAFAHSLVHGNPLVEQIRMRGGVDPDDVVAVVAEALRRAFPTGSMPVQTIFFDARKR